LGSLEQIYEQEDNFIGQAGLSLKESYNSAGFKLENRLALLTTAVKQFRQGKNETAAVLTEDEVRLLKSQSAYESKMTGCPPGSLLDASLNDTLKLIIRKKDWKELDDMVKKFKVPERRYSISSMFSIFLFLIFECHNGIDCGG